MAILAGAVLVSLANPFMVVGATCGVLFAKAAPKRAKIPVRMILISFLLLVTVAKAAPSFEVPIQKGWLFSRARAALLVHGWKPKSTHFTLADGTPTSRAGPAGEMWDAGYQEVEDCSEGLVYCLFNYSRQGQCLLLITQGEFVPGRSPKVVRWLSQCPNHR